jgi:hypothetical protein
VYSEVLTFVIYNSSRYFHEFHVTLSTPVSVRQPKSQVPKILESVGRVLIGVAAVTFAREYNTEKRGI